MAYDSYLAPIHDYTGLAFRRLCQKYGADAVCVPLVSSAAIAMDESRISLIDAHPAEKNVGVQLFGSDARMLGKAAGTVARKLPHVSWLNLNCGCPSSRTMNDGSGSAMLQAPGLIAESVSMMKESSGLPVSVKIRLHGGMHGTLALCRMVEGAGADSIIIHGRTVKQGYSGKADWGAIRHIAREIGIPVIGNGDIGSLTDGNMRVQDGFCASFMVGRAAMANPMLFSGRAPSSDGARFALLREYLDIRREYLGKTTESSEARDLKMKAMNFVSGMKGAAAIRARICKAPSAEQVLATESSGEEGGG